MINYLIQFTFIDHQQNETSQCGTSLIYIHVYIFKHLLYKVRRLKFMHIYAKRMVLCKKHNI